jgi:hypothetical protein
MGAGTGLFEGLSPAIIPYQTPGIRSIATRKKDYVAELDALIERSLFGKYL